MILSVVRIIFTYRRADKPEYERWVNIFFKSLTCKYCMFLIICLKVKSFLNHSKYHVIYSSLTKNDFSKYTISENIIATIKIRNKFCYPLIRAIFQYCHSNIGLFSNSIFV